MLAVGILFNARYDIQSQEAGPTLIAGGVSSALTLAATMYPTAR